jgi:Ca-activated chloride channel family protein
MQSESARRTVCVACVLALLACVHAARTLAQDPPPRPVFSSRSDLVVLHVTVLDGRSGFVSGLPREAFRVYEDGRPQEIEFFSNEDSPVTVGLVIDSSGSMQRKREAVIAAGLAFAQSSHPQDEMFTVHFNERVWTGLPGNQPFTSDLSELRAALERSAARGRTAFFDAVTFALRHLETGHRQKKVLVVISDGGDNASTTTFEELLDRAHRADAVIYAIGLSDWYDREADPDVLRDLAKATGGEAFFVRNTERAKDRATEILSRIARDIRSGYTIGYTPEREVEADADGFRTVKVEVSAPDRRKLTVRARAGYVTGSRGDGAQ